MRLRKLSSLILKLVSSILHASASSKFGKLTHLYFLDLPAKLEANANLYWDKFYKFHADRFFNDRHWFSAEFPALLTASSILEVGCGVGNTVFPLLEINPTAHVYACDFAPTAINIVHQHPLYKSSNRVTAFVADLINDDMLINVPRGTVDACTMIFVLSAISPEAMPAAVANVKRTLRRSRNCSSGSGSNNSRGGGRILFRDYAAGDLAQERLQREYKQQRLGEGFYMRGDGTRAYYFTETFVLELFEQQGFRCDSLVVKDMVKVNRSTGVTMGRKFLHGVFTLAEEEEEDNDYEELSGGDNGGKGVEKPCWTPFRKSNKNILEESSTVVLEYIEGEVKIEKEKDTIDFVELGDRMPTHSENYSSQYNSCCASKVLAKVILRCPEFFHDINVVQVRCGGSNYGFAGLPLFAALRWCRRALAVDQRRDAIEIFRKYAIKNGWQFSYEKLRVAIEPSSSIEEESISNDVGKNWAAAAFQGPIHGVLACIESQDSLAVVQEVLSSASKVLPKGQGGFLLLVGPREILSLENGKGEEVGVMAAQVGFKCEACKLPTELLKASQGIYLAQNSVMLYRSIQYK
jgi:methyltransferase-like protein 6